MKQISIIEKIRLKKLTGFLAVALVLLFGLSFATNFLGVPKSAKAVITDSATATTISGGTYVIDQNGNILAPPSIVFKDENGATLDYRYYTYLFVPTTPSYNVLGKDLVLDNSAYVMMEGTQTLNSLTVRGGSRISQPFADRSGNINNKPLYTNNYWGMRLTGFLKIPANKVYYLDAYDVDDGVSIDIGDTDRIDSSTDWRNVYSDRTWAYSEAQWGRTNLNVGTFWTDNESVLRLTAGATDRYVPIRITIGEKTGMTRCQIRYNRYNAGHGYETRGYVLRSDLYGVGTDNHVNLTSGHYLMNFEYYVSIANEAPIKNLSNAIKTSWRNNIDLTSSFRPAMYGDHWDGNNDLKFYWDQNENTGFKTVYDESPLGKSELDQDGAFPYREASRYSAFPVNPNLDIDINDLAIKNRRIPGGLNLNVTGDINIEGNGRIDLTGTGYPGATTEFSDNGSFTDPDLGGLITPNDVGDNTRNRVGRIRGGSLEPSGSPGGGYSDNVGCNGAAGGGGSHAGRGGYIARELGNGCGIFARADFYGDRYNPTTMGSGAGTSNDDAKSSNIGGSGGGSLVIRSSSLIINNGYIDVSGSAGKYVRWTISAGGAGGAVNIATTTFNVTGGGIAAEGSDGRSDNRLEAFVGGGGGYIHLEYDSGSTREIVTGALSVIGGNGGSRENGLDWGGSNIDGEPGIIDLVSCRKSSAGVLKKLIAVDRGGVPNRGFNPYALQVGDVITVEISVGSLTTGVRATIEDESLRVPGGTHMCVPINGTALPGVPDLSFLNDDGVGWTRTPASETEIFSYRCRVR